jgi:vitamin B12 transporter
MSRIRLVLAVPASLPCLIAGLLPVAAQSDPPIPTGRELVITITANRVPTAIQRTGSAITVIGAETIRKANPGSLVDALRYVPGLDISETGGPGGATTVRLRGGNGGQTLVLVDGMRMNDPASASGEFDFATIPPGLIDRIEILRGPQSALYGSDAMGGVINILTKRGSGPFKAFAQVEGGSYGTLAGNAGFHGRKGAWDYSFSLSGLHTEGFSKYGYRVARLRARAPFEKDQHDTIGGFGRVGYTPGTGFRFEMGALHSVGRTGYDAAFGAMPDTPSIQVRRTSTAFARAELDTLDNRLTHAVTLSAGRTSRFFRDTALALGGAVTSWNHSGFTGDRLAAEYQGTLKLNAFGTLIFGARSDHETAETWSQRIIPAGPRLPGIDRRQATHSAFALWQVPVGERLDLSFGGRIDKVTQRDAFVTWRATGAYRITETDTKLRASIGTGAKAPTLFQIHGGFAGTVPLQAEHNIGGDIGIDQHFLDGRIKLSATAFYARYRDMINFQSHATCPVALPFGCYVNIARAETSGIELEGQAILWRDVLSLRGAYTFLRAKDLVTGQTLARRPEHTAKLALAITPIEKLTLEPSVTLVSKRFSGNNETQRLAPYARFDMLVNYRVSDNLDLYLRGENLTNARYSEVFNYGTTGRAVYAGMKATW